MEGAEEREQQGLLSSPPSHILSDYMELASLLVLFAVGAPLNLVAWTQLEERRLSGRGSLSVERLKRHLNYSDLLVMFMYIPGRAYWLFCYDWRAGRLLCKLFKFMHAFCLQLSSNVVVCIALDRLFVLLLSAAARRGGGQRDRATAASIVIAWTLAAAISGPQLFVWDTIEGWPGWYQCVSIWQKVLHESHVRLQLAGGANRTANSTTSAVFSHFSDELKTSSRLYGTLHTAALFWLPASVIVFCYVIIVLWIRRTNKFSQQAANDQNAVRFTVDCGTTQTTVYTQSRYNGRQAAVCRLHEEEGGGELNRSSALLQQAESVRRRRAVAFSSLIVALYLICWFPYNALQLWQLMDVSGSEKSDAYYVLFAVVLFNSVINPFIYSMV